MTNAAEELIGTPPAHVTSRQVIGGRIHLGEHSGGQVARHLQEEAHVPSSRIENPHRRVSLPNPLGKASDVPKEGVGLFAELARRSVKGVRIAGLSPATKVAQLARARSFQIALQQELQAVARHVNIRDHTSSSNVHPADHVPLVGLHRSRQ